MNDESEKVGRKKREAKRNRDKRESEKGLIIRLVYGSVRFKALVPMKCRGVP